MPDLEVNMRRTESGLLVPDHVISTKVDEQLPEPKAPEKPKSRPSSVLKLNRATRRRLGKPWRGRKMMRDLARRQASEKAKAGELPVIKKAKKQRGCSEDCPCHLQRVPALRAGGTGA